MSGDRYIKVGGGSSCELTRLFLQNNLDANAKLITTEFDVNMPLNTEGEKSGVWSMSYDQTNMLLYVTGLVGSANQQMFYLKFDWTTRTLSSTTNVKTDRDNYLVLEKSPLGNYLAVSSITGDLRVYDNSDSQLGGFNNSNLTKCRHIFWSEDESSIYLSNFNTTTLYKFDFDGSSTPTLNTSFALSDDAISSCVHDGIAYMLPTNSKKVIRWDLDTDTELSSITPVDDNELLKGAGTEDSGNYMGVYVDDNYTILRDLSGALIFFEDETFSAISHIEIAANGYTGRAAGQNISMCSLDCMPTVLIPQLGLSQGESRGIRESIIFRDI